MTLAFPDVSNHNAAMPLEAGTVACLAKASEGTYYRDPYYLHFKAEAARVGALFGAYHFLREGNGAAQARFAYGIIGPGVPTMIDFEPEYDSAGGPVSLPTIGDAVAFRDTFRSLGGLVRLNYLPRWYWQQLGSPSLAPLADLALVSSNYTAYSDTGPGWEPYGGLTPAIWQWTDALPYSGQRVDFNAYRGTLAQLRALLGLATLEADMPLTPQDITAVTQSVHDSILNHPLGEVDLAGNATGKTVTVGVAIARASAMYAALTAQEGAELAGLQSIAAKVGQIQAPQITQDALNAAVAAALQDPAVARGIAHALAVELHNDTPAS